MNDQRLDEIEKKILDHLIVIENNQKKSAYLPLSIFIFSMAITMSIFSATLSGDNLIRYISVVFVVIALTTGFWSIHQWKKS